MPLALAFKPEVRFTAGGTGALLDVFVDAVDRNLVPGFMDDLVLITSLNDSVHAEGSLHYRGLAFDFRLYGRRPGALRSRLEEQPLHAQALRDFLASVLPETWDVVLEADHMHVEYDPKRA